MTRKRFKLEITITAPARFSKRTAEGRVRELLGKDADWLMPADAMRHAIKPVAVRALAPALESVR